MSNEDRPDESGAAPEEDVHSAEEAQASAAHEVDQSQATQADLVRETLNGPTDSDEEDVLRELYGEMDADGVYGPRDASDLEGGEA